MTTDRAPKEAKDQKNRRQEAQSSEEAFQVEATAPLHPDHATILHLQRTIGNHAVQRLVAQGRLSPNGTHVQTKPAVAETEEDQEQDMETVAEADERVFMPPDDAIVGGPPSGSQPGLRVQSEAENQDQVIPTTLPQLSDVPVLRKPEGGIPETDGNSPNPDQAIYDGQRIAEGVYRYADPTGLVLYRVGFGSTQVTLTATEFLEREDKLVAKVTNFIERHKTDAKNLQESHKEHLENVRGWAGLVSDWLNDVVPPSPTMWSPTIRTFERAQTQVAERNWDAAYSNLRLALQWLENDKRTWHQYLDDSIAGAATIVGVLEVVRDAAIAVEIGLVTGGVGYGILGGGALGAAGGTVAGVVGFTATGAAMGAAGDSEFGKAVLGTLSEVEAAGIQTNLRYAANGLWGMVVGVGAGFEAMFEGLGTLFTDPGKFIEDLTSLPQHINTLWEHRQELWRHFQSLPPEEQSFRVGQFFGAIEATLIAAETAKAAGTAIADTGGITLGGSGGMAAGSELVFATETLIQLNAEAAAIFGGVVANAGTGAMMVGGAGEMGDKAKGAVEEVEKGEPARPEPGKTGGIPEGSEPSYEPGTNLQDIVDNAVPKKPNFKGANKLQPGEIAGDLPYKNVSQPKLPEVDAAGKPITYREYDIHPYDGINRGSERVVIGTDSLGNKTYYYTSDHYNSWTRFYPKL